MNIINPLVMTCALNGPLQDVPSWFSLRRMLAKHSVFILMVFAPFVDGFPLPYAMI